MRPTIIFQRWLNVFGLRQSIIPLHPVVAFQLVPASERGKGLTRVSKFYSSLKPGSVERRMVDSALDSLKVNMTVGVKVPKPQWPRFYVRRYGVNNLWKMDLLKGARLTYTILSEQGRWIVIVLEAFLTHKEYEEGFGYR